MAGENPAVELQQSVFPLRSNNRRRWKQTITLSAFSEATRSSSRVQPPINTATSTMPHACKIPLKPQGPTGRAEGHKPMFFLATSLSMKGASLSQAAFSGHSAQVSKDLAEQHLRTSHRQEQKYVLTPSTLQPRQLMCSGLIWSVLFISHQSLAVLARSSSSLFNVAVLASHNSQSRPQYPIRCFIFVNISIHYEGICQSAAAPCSCADVHA